MRRTQVGRIQRGCNTHAKSTRRGAPAKAARRRRWARYSVGAGSTKVAKRRDSRSHLWRRPWCEMTASSTRLGSEGWACTVRYARAFASSHKERTCKNMHCLNREARPAHDTQLSKPNVNRQGSPRASEYRMTNMTHTGYLCFIHLELCS